MDWLTAWAVGLAIVLTGLITGRELLVAHGRHHNPGEPLLDAFVHWDANYYRDIAAEGYSYIPGQQSTIHFFPGYPVAAAFLNSSVGIKPEVALVLLSNLFFAAALFLAGSYVERRFGCDSPNLRWHVLLGLALLPVGFFFRMAYTESMFLFLVVLVLYLIERQASPWVVAAVAGIASATRPVGLILVLPVLWYVFGLRRKQRWFWLSVPICVLVSLSGLLVFAAYCYLAFGDSIIFARNRIGLWAMRPTPPLAEKALLLATLEPVRSIFDPSSPAYWGNKRDPPEVLFNLYPANPIYFLAALILMGVGVRKRWLNTPEILVGAGLILLPYCLTGYEGFMCARARYVSVAFPLYLVLGKLLERLDVVWKAPIACLSAVVMGGYSAYFGQYYWLI